LNDIFSEFKAEFQSFKDDMNKGFSSLDKSLSTAECHVVDFKSEEILFQKFIIKFIGYIINAGCFMMGGLIVILIDIFKL
jgi:hypothetical protein